MTETSTRGPVLDGAGQTADFELESVRKQKGCSPCMAKLDRLSWTDCDWFEIENYRFGVRTTSPAFAHWIRYTLGRYLAEGPSDADQDPLFSLVIEDQASLGGRTAKRYHILYEGTLDLVRSLDPAAVARSFVSELESLTFPVRRDAVYLEASIIRGKGKTVLIPSLMVPSITAAGRRIQRSVDVVLPGHMSLALEPNSGHLVPPQQWLDMPDDVLQSLGEYIPLGWPNESRALVDDRLVVDRVLLLRGEAIPGVVPESRGSALFQLARSIRNLGNVGGLGLATVGSLLAQADVLGARWFTTQQLVEVVAAAVNGGHYAPNRTEPTSEES